VKDVQYLSVIFDKKNYVEITYSSDHHPQLFISTYLLQKSECLSVSTKFTLYID